MNKDLNLSRNEQKKIEVNQDFKKKNLFLLRTWIIKVFVRNQYDDQYPDAGFFFNFVCTICFS